MASDYNLGSVINDVIDESKDSTTSRTRVTRYIQSTQDKVLGHQRYSFNEATLAVTLPVNSWSYQYETDHQQIIQLVLSNVSLPSALQPMYMPADEFFVLYPLTDIPHNVAGQPTYYTDFGQTLYFSCPLDLSYTLGLRYTAAPPRLDSEDDVPNIPVEFQDILFHGGMAGVEQRRENGDIATLHMRDIEELTEDLLGRYGMRKRQPGKVKKVGRRPYGHGFDRNVNGY